MVNGEKQPPTEHFCTAQLWKFKEEELNSANILTHYMPLLWTFPANFLLYISAEKEVNSMKCWYE